MQPVVLAENNFEYPDLKVSEPGFTAKFTEGLVLHELFLKCFFGA